METLKAWVHWKRLDRSIDEDERLFVEHINTILEQNQEMKKYLKFFTERLINLYDENENIDYIKNSRKLIDNR